MDDGRELFRSRRHSKRHLIWLACLCLGHGNAALASGWSFKDNKININCILFDCYNIKLSKATFLGLQITIILVFSLAEIGQRKKTLTFALKQVKTLFLTYSRKI